MSHQSDRRRAEIAVIDAAYKLREAMRHAFDTRLHDPEEVGWLCDAVDAHAALGLAPLSTRGETSNNTTDTANAAAASLGDVAGLAMTCFNEIVVAGGLTTDQLEVVLNRPHQTVSARVYDLARKGWIVDSGLKRKTRSGRQAIVWRPTMLALEKIR